MPKPQLKTSTWAYLSIHREEEAHYPIVFSLALVFLSSPTESPSPRFHPTRKQEFVVKISPSRVSVDFFLLLPCCYGPLIRGFVDLGKRRWGGRPAAIWREGDGRREGADRGQVSALRRHGHRAHQVRPLHHSLRAQGVHPRSVAARWGLLIGSAHMCSVSICWQDKDALVILGAEVFAVSWDSWIVYCFFFTLCSCLVFLHPLVVMLVAYGARGMLDFFFPGCMVNWVVELCSIFLVQQSPRTGYALFN